MSHTPEMSAAIEDLERAIDAVIKLRGDDARYLTDWVVIAATQGFETQDTRYSRLVPGRSMPYHALLGLLTTGIDLLKEGDANDEGG